MNIYNFLIPIFFTLINLSAHSQQSIYDKHEMFQDWSMTFSFISLDDDNSGTSDIIKYSNWSKTLFPSKITLCTKLDKNISTEISTGLATLSRNNSLNRFPFVHLFCDIGMRLGANLNYSKGRSLTRRSIVNLGQVYLITGIGLQYMSRDVNNTFETFNIGAGFDIFIIERFCSLNMCSVAKFSIGKNSGTNLSMHSIGLTFYRNGFINDWIKKRRRVVVSY